MLHRFKVKEVESLASSGPAETPKEEKKKEEKKKEAPPPPPAPKEEEEEMDMGDLFG